jgi:hypothetical protein
MSRAVRYLLEEIVGRAVLLLDLQEVLLVTGVLKEGFPSYRVRFASSFAS